MDAKIPFKVIIKVRDAACGKPGDTDNCVVAKAIKRQLGDAEVCVGKKITCILQDGVLVRTMTPNKIAKRLALFDKTGCWSLPFGTYEFRPPSESYKIESRIADTNARRPKKYVSKGKRKKGFRFAATRALHSRTSSNFKKSLNGLVDRKLFR